MPTKERKNDFIQLGLLLPFLYLYSLLAINFFEIGYFHVLNIPLQLIRVELQNNSYYIFIFLVVVIFLFTIVEIAKNTFTTIRKGK
ncbi:hypothetical protein [Chitinophaga sp. CF418]|uniref:hypothetical protein n=1 Tax=Chitinophaga sp. CF418 TaxID=1855287 RepID=UPI000919A640|nr:hypothetical protein [Chitinophaga sp. CF418]SHN45552.1 hypothetical protein SAMN05216311_120104 [Chitinophaga sp. CF418]